MKLRRFGCLIIGVTLFCSLVSMKSLLSVKEEGKKNNLIINYDNKQVIGNNVETDDDDVRVKVMPSDDSTEIRVLPIPNTSDKVILDEL